MIGAPITSSPVGPSVRPDDRELSGTARYGKTEPEAKWRPGVASTTTLAAMLLLAACGDGGAGTPNDQVRFDTLADGAVQVQSPSEGVWSDEQRWRLVEEVRIGTTTGGGPAAFGDVRGLALDDLGRVWVVDTEAVEIRVFERNGDFVRSVGQEGEGPGELQYPNGIANGPDGRIHVFDPQAHRIAVFDTTGRTSRGVGSRWWPRTRWGSRRSGSTS